MRKTLFLAMLAVVALTFLVGPRQVLAESKSESTRVYEEVRTRYFKLRNTDIHFAKISEWEHILKDFERFTKKYSKSPLSAKALFHSATIKEQQYRQFGDEELLNDSIKLYGMVADMYPDSDSADDALIRQADIELYDRHHVDKAREICERVVAQYPRADMLEVAKERLREIESGEGNGDKEDSDSSGKPVVGAGSFVVVIDPGHGGEDTGAEGQGGLLEKDVTLAIALELERLLQKESGIEVRLTRRADVFVPLAERTAIANTYERGIFISLHANASANRKLNGLQTFYLETAGDEASRLLAERENASAGQDVDDLQFMLSDLVQAGKMRDSMRLSRTLHRAVLNYVRIRWDGISDKGIKKAPFFVLVGAHLPCVLVEMFFIDHAVDGVRLGQKEYRSDLAYGLYKGIVQYFESVSH